MNVTIHRLWPSLLVTILAVFYLWIAVVAHGSERLLAVAGAVLILAALAAAGRSRPAATGLLVAGALSLALAVWWSIVVPLLAIFTLGLGWVAIARLTSPRPAVPAPAGTGLGS